MTAHNWTDEPVLVIAFNRPDHLARVLERLREVRVGRLFVSIDGPRPDRPEDHTAVQECQDLVRGIDWTSDVHIQFHEVNLGCGAGVSSAITWFFTQVERGIILEDDIVADPTFFPFCHELLDRYQNDTRVFAVSGCNFVPREYLSNPGDAYRFSQVPHIWGWATWRRTWDQHRLDISGWTRSLPPSRLWRASGRSIPGSVYWASTFELLARKQVDTWDGQLVFASMVSQQLTATSNVNLVTNIGFDALATHTHEDRNELQPVTPISLPTTPVTVECDQRADAWTRNHHFRATWPGMIDQGRTFLRRQRAGAA